MYSVKRFSFDCTLTYEWCVAASTKRKTYTIADKLKIEKVKNGSSNGSIFRECVSVSMPGLKLDKDLENISEVMAWMELQSDCE